MKKQKYNIGNWVSVNKIPFQIHWIKNNNVGLLDNLHLSEGNYDRTVNLVHIQPIELTKELFDKLGFVWCEKDPELSSKHFSSNYTKSAISVKGRVIPVKVIVCKNGTYSFMGYNFIHDEIIYVHQLQNLYFALTGEELSL